MNEQVGWKDLQNKKKQNIFETMSRSIFSNINNDYLQIDSKGKSKKSHRFVSRFWFN